MVRFVSNVKIFLGEFRNKYGKLERFIIIVCDQNRENDPLEHIGRRDHIKKSPGKKCDTLFSRGLVEKVAQLD